MKLTGLVARNVLCEGIENGTPKKKKSDLGDDKPQDNRGGDVVGGEPQGGESSEAQQKTDPHSVEEQPVGGGTPSKQHDDPSGALQPNYVQKKQSQKASGVEGGLKNVAGGAKSFSGGAKGPSVGGKGASVGGKGVPVGITHIPVSSRKIDSWNIEWGEEHVLNMNSRVEALNNHRKKIVINNNNADKIVASMEETFDQDTLMEIDRLNDKITINNNLYKDYYNKFNISFNIFTKLMDYISFRKKLESASGTPHIHALLKNKDVLEKHEELSVIKVGDKEIDLNDPSTAKIKSNCIDMITYLNCRKYVIDHTNSMNRALSQITQLVQQFDDIVSKKYYYIRQSEYRDKKRQIEPHQYKDSATYVKFNSYMAWAMSSGHTPPEWHAAINYAQKFPLKRTMPRIIKDMYAEEMEDVVSVANWLKPLAWTQGSPSDVKIEEKFAEMLGWSTLGNGRGTIWYNVWDNMNAYYKMKEWQEKYAGLKKLTKEAITSRPKKSKKGIAMAKCLAWNVYANLSIHPSLYHFVSCVLLGYDKDITVKVADMNIHRGTNIFKKDNKTFWQKIIDRLKHNRDFLFKNKPRISRSIDKLIDNVSDIYMLEGACAAAATDNLFLKNIIREDIKLRNGIDDDAVDVLFKSAFDVICS